MKDDRQWRRLDNETVGLVLEYLRTLLFLTGLYLPNKASGHSSGDHSHFHKC